MSSLMYLTHVRVVVTEGGGQKAFRRSYCIPKDDISNALRRTRHYIRNETTRAVTAVTTPVRTGDRTLRETYLQRFRYRMDGWLVQCTIHGPVVYIFLSGGGSRWGVTSKLPKSAKKIRRLYFTKSFNS